MTYLITPFFGKNKMLDGFLDYLYRTPPNVTHIITDNHYPMPGDGPNVEQIAKKYGCIYVDSGGDIGLHRSLNHAVDVCGIGRDDILVGCDADDRPSPKFVHAISKVMTRDRSIAVCALNFWVIDMKRREQPNGYELDVIAKEPIAINKTVEMWCVAGFNMQLIHDTGGFNQPNQYYGGLEIDLYNKWQPRGMKLAYLLNYKSDCEAVDRENPDLFDKEYRLWKTAHVEGYTGSFAEWLHQTGKS